MLEQRQLAYLLVGVGLVGLLSRLTADAGWLWVALVAAAFLILYVRQHGYAFLVIGAIMMGTAAGILLEGNWHWNGAFLVSLGAGFYAIDVVERRPARWPRWVGVLLIALGVLTGLVESGLFGSALFGGALVLAGAYLLWRGRRPARVAASVKEPTASAYAPPPAPTTTPKPPVATPPAVPAAMSDADLLEALRSWRRSAAGEAGIGEGLVLTEATLAQLVDDRPTTPEALRQVGGIGPVKMERYGTALLRLLRSAGPRPKP